MSNAEALAATNSEAAVGELTAGRSEIKGNVYEGASYPVEGGNGVASGVLGEDGHVKIGTINQKDQTPMNCNSFARRYLEHSNRSTHARTISSAAKWYR